MSVINFSNCSKIWTFPSRAATSFEFTGAQPCQSGKCKEEHKERRPRAGRQSRVQCETWSLGHLKGRSPKVCFKFWFGSQIRLAWRKRVALTLSANDVRHSQELQVERGEQLVPGKLGCKSSWKRFGGLNTFLVRKRIRCSRRTFSGICVTDVVYLNMLRASFQFVKRIGEYV